MARILVVEDEETLAEAIAFLLSKEGFEVSVAATGPDAITEFDKNGADLILLDLILSLRFLLICILLWVVHALTPEWYDFQENHQLVSDELVNNAYMRTDLL